MTRTQYARDFWNRQARRYAQQPVADEAAYQHKLSMTQSYLRPTMEVLEFGCGTGSTALAHAPFVRTILATDLSEEMIEIARRKAEDASVSNVRFAAVSVEELDAAPGQFDAVLGLSVLHLVDDLRGTLARVATLLKPGGLFFTNTVCVGDMGAAARVFVKLLAMARLGPPVNSFGAADLREQLGAAGFETLSSWQPARDKALFIVSQKRA